MKGPPTASIQHAASRDSDRQIARELEWPTLLVALAIYGGYGAVTWWHEALPWWLVAMLGGYLVAWHGSLQHEVVHEHPTRWRAFNEALVWPSLWLWLPFRIYRDSHRAHHQTQSLTDPRTDPESYYLEAGTWRRLPRLGKAALVAHNTLLGRLLLGPAILLVRFAVEQGRAIWHDRPRLRRRWLLHAVSVAVVLGWTMGICGIPLHEYLALYVYPGISLTLLRSFLEHNAAADTARRTAVVESGPVLSLLFLNNNLHVAHHAEPWLAWYRLPARWRTLASGADADLQRYRGYREVARRYALRTKEPVLYPSRREPSGTQPAASG